MPLVSVITPALNAAPVLRETIESVQAQSFTDWEMIIIDDGSMDSTIPIAERVALKDERIRIIRLAEHGGTAQARNKGLDAAKGRYAAFINAGDVWVPEKLEQQLDFMRTHNAALSCTAWRRFHVGSKSTGRRRRCPAHITFDHLLRYNSVHLSTLLVDRERLSSFRFNSTYATHANLATLLDITKSGYDIHGMNQDLMLAAPLKPYQYRTVFYRGWYLWLVYREVAGLPRGKALAMFMAHLGIRTLKNIF